MEETWKVIPDHEKYEASNLGNIRNKLTKYVLKKYTTPQGYHTMTIQKTKYVHRLVAQTWIPNLKNEPTVDHINHDKTDNRVENLRWASHKLQVKNRRKKRATVGFQRAVEQICLKTGSVLNTFSSIMIATRETGAVHECITRTCKGRQQSSGGFGWKYAPDRECPGEIWKPLQQKGYKLSSYGRVFSPKYKIMDFQLKTKSTIYPQIRIKEMLFGIHILVAKTFLPNPHEKQFVNHKDGDKWNPHVDNLEWCTKSENAIHAVNTGLTSGSIHVHVTNTITGTKRKYMSMKQASIALEMKDYNISYQKNYHKRTNFQHNEYHIQILNS